VKPVRLEWLHGVFPVPITFLILSLFEVFASLFSSFLLNHPSFFIFSCAARSSVCLCVFRLHFPLICSILCYLRLMQDRSKPKRAKGNMMELMAALRTTTSAYDAAKTKYAAALSKVKSAQNAAVKAKPGAMASSVTGAGAGAAAAAGGGFELVRRASMSGTDLTADERLMLKLSDLQAQLKEMMAELHKVFRLLVFASLAFFSCCVWDPCCGCSNRKLVLCRSFFAVIHRSL
jgi:hypothetical protein